ncbi:MAG: hypothetical protein KDA60_21305 [Planctomycetales bacterium]|nr:hypothetical protein [Planctomycetales bacterium]
MTDNPYQSPETDQASPRSNDARERPSASACVCGDMGVMLSLFGVVLIAYGAHRHWNPPKGPGSGDVLPYVLFGCVSLVLGIMSLWRAAHILRS